MLIAEAIRNAQKLSGKKAITGEDLRRGLETLNMTEARWAELGAPGFAAPIQLSCADHNGHNKVYMVEWDGTKWTRGSDWIEPMKDKVRAAARRPTPSPTPRRTPAGRSARRRATGRRKCGQPRHPRAALRADPRTLSGGALVRPGARRPRGPRLSRFASGRG